MFKDINKNIAYLKGSYKKLKSYYYYNKSMFFIRKKIAEFESSDMFEDTFLKLAECLNDFAANHKYIDSLFQKIGVKILPKSFDDNENGEIAAISNYFKEQKKLRRVNFYIDAPIELLILDSLWTVLLAKVAKDEGLYGETMYGNLPHRNLFYQNTTDFQEENISFKSIHMFANYFDKYCDWRDDAFRILKKRKSDGEDSILYSLDIKNFFYQVDFSYDDFVKLFNESSFLAEFDGLSEIVFQSARIYCQQVNELRSDLKISNEKNIIFPIGYLSSLVISNIYLRNFDKEIVRKLSPCFFGRYVDDILIVLPVKSDTFEKKRSNVKVFQKKLMDVFLNSKLFKESSGSLFIASYPNLFIQKQKVSCMHIAAKGSTNLFNIYEDLFKRKPSIVNQMADFDLHFSRFSNYAYEIKAQTNNPRVKDLVTIFAQGGKTKKFVDNSILCSLATYITERAEGFLESNFDELIAFYADAKGLENQSTWLSLFYLFVVNHRPDYANKYFAQIAKDIKEIKYIKIEDVYSDKEEYIIKKVRKDFLEELEVAYETAFALNLKNCNASSIANAFLFRKSNMFRQDLTVYPLMNFSDRCDNPNFSLIDFYDYSEKEKFPFKLSQKKLEFTPRFISFSELNLYHFFISIFAQKSNFIRDYKGIEKKYYSINGITDNGLLYYEEVEYNDFIVKNYRVASKSEQMHRLGFRNEKTRKRKEKEGKPSIAVASVNLSIKQVMDRLEKPKEALSIKFKKKLFSLVFNAIKEHVDILVFPEFYMPFEWVGTIAKICAKNSLTIVSGLQYIRTAVGIKNYGIIIQPLLSKYGNRGSLELLREKNYYAPDEKKLLLTKKLPVKDAEKPSYDIVTCGGQRYSSIICYELTDIKTRALLKGKVNEVFAIEFNSDTNYYSSLVESLARDIQAFVVQVNTAQYGDSRITAPYKTEQKDIVKIKGGENDTFIVGQINIAELNAHIKSYHRNFQNSIRLAANPKRTSRIKSQAKRLSVEEKKDLIAEINKSLPKEKPLSAGNREDVPE